MSSSDKGSGEITSKDVKVTVSIDASGNLTANATFVDYDEDGEETKVGKELSGSCKLVNSKGASELNDTDVRLFLGCYIIFF
jgi:hypothetical protein